MNLFEAQRIFRSCPPKGDPNMWWLAETNRLGCEQLPRVVQAAGNNPVDIQGTFTSTL
jgi:hypothetical protein